MEAICGHVIIEHSTYTFKIVGNDKYLMAVKCKFCSVISDNNAPVYSESKLYI